MALKILKADEPYVVEQLVSVIYGAPGIGKTTMGFSTKAPLLLDFDCGGYRGNIRGDLVKIKSWEDARVIEESDLEGYSTVIVDTVGGQIEYLQDWVEANFPKMKNANGLTISGWGKVKAEFNQWLNKLKRFGKDIVLVSHMDEIQTSDGVMQERLKIAGGAKAIVYQSADIMGRLYVDNNQTIFNCIPGEVSFGKCPGRPEPEGVPEITGESQFFHEFLARAKKHLNEMTAAQALVYQATNEMMEKIALLAEDPTVEGFNALSDELTKAPDVIKASCRQEFRAVAENANVSWDKETGLWWKKDKDVSPPSGVDAEVVKTAETDGKLAPVQQALLDENEGVPC